jgi:hypothetical protein
MSVSILIMCTVQYLNTPEAIFLTYVQMCKPVAGFVTANLREIRRNYFLYFSVGSISLFPRFC